MSETRTQTVVTTIAEAKVYRSGCTIVRRGQAQLEQGTSLLVIEGLPEGLDEASISLRMPPVVSQGQVRVVCEELSVIEEKASPTQELDEQIDELDRQIDNKQLELEAWKDLAAKMGGSAAIEYLGKLPGMLDQLTSELSKLRTDRRTLSQQRDEQREQHLRPRLEVEVEVPQQGTYPVELACRSSRAGWKPSYDVLVGSLDEALMLRRKGQAWQRTGDDWENVTLRLSTGTATVMGDLPRFGPRYLRKWEEPKLAKASRSALPLAASRTGSGMFMGALSESVPSADDTATGSWGFDDVEELAAPEAAMTEQATATTYELAGVQTLAQGANSQTFTLATSELAATYYHYSYPRREEASYLVARLDTEPTPDVLEQPLSVYIEGSYAGTIRIGRSADEDGYELPLGRDDRVRVRRTEDVRRSKRLLGGKVTVEHSCSIVVENRKSERLNLVVLEQVPVSRDKDIEVSLRESSGASFDEERGELRWEREVEPSKRVALRAEYAISHARGVRVDEFENPTSGYRVGSGFCPQCGSPVSLGLVFCSRCGARIG